MSSNVRRRTDSAEVVENSTFEVDDVISGSIRCTGVNFANKLQAVFFDNIFLTKNRNINCKKFTRKMLIKLTPVAGPIKLFSSFSDFAVKLECLLNI